MLLMLILHGLCVHEHILASSKAWQINMHTHKLTVCYYNFEGINVLLAICSIVAVVYIVLFLI